MRRRWSILGFARWAVLALVVILAVAWIGQSWYQATLRVGDWKWLSMRGGCVEYESMAPVRDLPRWLPHPILDVRPKYDPANPWASAHPWSWKFEIIRDPIYLGTLIVRVPMWMILTAAVVPAAVLWLPRLRGKRAGICVVCGYDRRGLAEGAKCPECGRV